MNALALWVSVVVWLLALASLGRAVRPRTGDVILLLASLAILWPPAMALIVRAQGGELSVSVVLFVGVVALLGGAVATSATHLLISARKPVPSTMNLPAVPPRFILTSTFAVLFPTLALLFTSFATRTTTTEPGPCGGTDVYILTVPLPAAVALLILMVLLALVACLLAYRHVEVSAGVVVSRGIVLVAAVALGLTSLVVAMPTFSGAENYGDLTCQIN